MGIVEEADALPDPDDRTRRQNIIATVDDLVGDLMYYGRKEDEVLPRDAIEDAVEAGEITVAEILVLFEDRLRGWV